MAESVARQRINWRVLGIEAAAIFLSVLLGFGVTEWREHRSESKRQHTLLHAFALEIEANRENLTRQGSYHHWLLRQMSQGMAEGNLTRLSDVFQIENMNGFNPLSQERAAWATATATGDISLLDFETAGSLWRLSNAQEAIDTEQLRLRSNALEQFNDPDPQLVQEFAFALQEFTALERELMSLLNTALAEVAEASGASPPVETPVTVLCQDPFASAPVALPDECP